MKNWTPPEHWFKIITIDAHTEGEPFRVITGGYPELPGESTLARRRYAIENLDHLRTALMWEPRGHADMYGCIVTPPVSPQADFGVLFMHNEGYSTMCGHGIIGITTVALEAGLLPMTSPETQVKIDTPAGLVTAYARVDDGRVQSVYFHNVPLSWFWMKRSTYRASVKYVTTLPMAAHFMPLYKLKRLGCAAARRTFGRSSKRGWPSNAPS